MEAHGEHGLANGAPRGIENRGADASCETTTSVDSGYKGSTIGATTNSFYHDASVVAVANAAATNLHRRTSSTTSTKTGTIKEMPVAMNTSKSHRRMGSNLSASITASLVEKNRCGWFCIKPDCMQGCAHPIIFLLSLMIMVFAQSIGYSGYLSSINTTIEQHFGLTTQEIGLIYASYEVACLTATIFISYFGHRHNRAKLLGCGCFLIAIGYLLFTLPKFLAKVYTPNIANETVNDICVAAGSTRGIRAETSCQTASNNDTWAFYIFCAAMMIVGLGSSPVYVFGPTYLWDNLETRLYPTYSAWVYVTAALGPAVGFILGSYFLSLWVDYPLPPPANLNDTDVQWVGAWWIGMLIFSGLALIAAIPLLAFPSSLPRKGVSKKHFENSLRDSMTSVTTLPSQTTTMTSVESKSLQENSLVSNASFYINDEKANFQHSPTTTKHNLAMESTPSKRAAMPPNDASAPKWRVTSISSTTAAAATAAVNCKKIKPRFASALLAKILNLPISVKRLLTNPVWFFITFLTIVEQSVINAFVAFISKYLQVVFLVPPSRASLFTGGVIIPSAVFGILLGAFLVRRFNLRVLGNAKMLFMLCSSTSILTIILMFMSCYSPLVGLSSGSTPNFTASCNAQCGCKTSMYNPVCMLQTKNSYLSACYAGCGQTTTTSTFVSTGQAKSVIQYANCTCYNGGNSSLPVYGTAVPGKCEEQCSTFIPFLVLLFVLVFLTAMGQNPANIITLSCVSREDSSFSVGLQIFLQRVLAFIPAPIYFGSLFDAACSLRTTLCGDGSTGGGDCVEYDLKKLPFMWLGTALALKSVGLVLAVCTCYAAERTTALDLKGLDDEASSKQATADSNQVNVSIIQNVLASDYQLDAAAVVLSTSKPLS